VTAAAYSTCRSESKHIILKTGRILSGFILWVGLFEFFDELVVDVVNEPHEELVTILMSILLKYLILLLNVCHKLLS
jgi:hypothetical protein